MPRHHEDKDFVKQLPTALFPLDAPGDLPDRVSAP